MANDELLGRASRPTKGGLEAAKGARRHRDVGLAFGDSATEYRTAIDICQEARRFLTMTDPAETRAALVAECDTAFAAWRRAFGTRQAEPRYRDYLAACAALDAHDHPKETPDGPR